MTLLILMYSESIYIYIIYFINSPKEKRVSLGQ